MALSPKVRIGAHPIIWSNDDFHELGGDVPLLQCLSEMRDAGYAGTELGHKFPQDARELAELLARHELDLVSGWHSTHLANRPFADERAAFVTHVDKLDHCGSRIVIVAECSRGRYFLRDEPLQWNGEAKLSRDEWDATCAGLEELAAIAEDRGMICVYHHHVGTVVQTEEELDRLMQETRRLMLLADTGHLLLAGIEPAPIFHRYSDRIRHVHLKSVRESQVARARDEKWSFAQAVANGVFTVPGDGDFDCAAVFAALAEARYEGWLIVEADQDPARANPREYAELARRYIRDRTGI